MAFRYSEVIIIIRRRIKILLNSFALRFLIHTCTSPFAVCLSLSLRNHKPTHSFPIPACQWLVDGCPTLKNILSHYWKVKIYELSKLPYFYYLVNPEAELFNPLKSLMICMWIKGCWVPFPTNVTCIGQLWLFCTALLGIFPWVFLFFWCRIA
jgi:hypothetical protein